MNQENLVRTKAFRASLEGASVSKGNFKKQFFDDPWGKTAMACLYLLVFFIPIFFLPWTADILDFNKQALMALLVFISLFCWIMKTIISGNFSVVLSKIHIAVAVFFLVYLASTIFSVWRYNSFLGWPQPISESFFSIISLVLFYFLASNIFSRKQILRAINILLVSGFLALLYATLQLLGLFSLPFSFSKTPSFNTIGSVGNIGFFCAVLLPIFIVSLITAGKRLKIFFGIAVLLSAVLLVLINYSTIWWIVGVGAVLLIFFGILKKDFFDIRWLALPMFFLGLSLFFLFFKLQITGLPARPIEVSLNQKISADIALRSISANPILGSGPATFVYNFLKYKDIGFNQGSLWNAKFVSAGSKILTILPTVGILGAIAFLALIFVNIFYGVKFLLTLRENEKNLWFAGLAVCCGFFTLACGYFLTNPSFSLEFLYFFFIACSVALTSRDGKKYVLKPSSLLTLGITFIFILISICGFSFLILEGQRYVSQMNYVKGLDVWQAGDTEAGIKYLEKAVSLNQDSDLYFRELSQAYFMKMREEVAKKDTPQEEKNNKAQLFANNAINAAKFATDINPKNTDNWSARGLIYQNLMGVVDGADDWAIKSYDEALNLEPNNPYLSTQKGIVFLNKALLLSQDQKSEKEQILLKAKEQLVKAIGLKSDYAPARFQIAMVYQTQGKIQDAIIALEETKKYASSDAGLFFQLGLIYYQEKNYQKAQGELERAIALNPNYSNALYLLGLVYDAQGEKKLATEKISRVLELNPANGEIKRILDNLKSGKRALEGISGQTLELSPGGE